MSAKDAHMKRPSHASKIKSASVVVSEAMNLNSISELLKDIVFPVKGSGNSKCMLQSPVNLLTFNPPPTRRKGGKDGLQHSRRATQFMDLVCWTIRLPVP